MPECRIRAYHVHSAEKARDTTLDDEKYNVHYRDWGHPIGKHERRHVASRCRDELCNQPEAFASDLGDDQSRYLYVLCAVVMSWWLLLVEFHWNIIVELQ